VVLGLANSGCSFIFVTPPPAHAEQASNPNAECSTSRAAPAIDGILTGLRVAGTLYAATAPDSAYQGAPISRGADIGLGLTFTALFLASTIYGVVNTTECRDFKARSVTPAPKPADSAVSPAPSDAPPAAAPATPPAAAPSPFTAVPKTNGAFPP
jgi:hypothetical protein